MSKHSLTKASAVLIQGFILVSLLAPVTSFAQARSATSPAPQSATTTAAARGAAGSSTSSGGGQTFTPLTQLPGLQDIASADNFSSFLNTLYKICIGAGTVLAVLMIMYAGVLIMTSSGSVSGNEKAKSYIQNAILGLVLVLTPTIVFGIINPSILNINIGQQFSKLRGRDLQHLDGSVGGTASSTGSGACNASANTYEASTATSCSTSRGFSSADATCCAGLASGSICCAKPTATSTPSRPAARPPAAATAARPAAATGRYAWQLYFVPKGRTTGYITRSGGPFTTAAACQADLTAKITENTQTLDVAGAAPLCACDRPLAQYPNCPIR